MNDENGDGADGAGKAGADQPAEATALADLGVVGLVEVLEGARGAAAIELRQPLRPLRGSERSKAPVRRIAAPIDHVAQRPSPSPNGRGAWERGGWARHLPGKRSRIEKREPGAEYSKPPGPTRPDSPWRRQANQVDRARTKRAA